MNTKTNFKNASEAFDYFYVKIRDKGIDFDNTKALFNVGFYLHNPSEKSIKASYRKWSEQYAEAEWKWYLSGDRNINKLKEIYGKLPEIWQHMADSEGNVMSNYGWQWQREDQLDYVVGKLKSKKDTRHAVISIYDGKEHTKYRKDTPCTYAVQFSVLNNKLCMSVYMRSNDLWYGFCNDQYQFASLQEMVAERLDIDTGWYYHHAHNLHLYNNKIK
jgi:thymidylate synthase